mgnify:CR=1 FL=1
MRKIHKIRFIKDNVSYELLIVGHKNKMMTYEFSMYTNISNKKSLIEKFIKN